MAKGVMELVKLKQTLLDQNWKYGYEFMIFYKDK